MLEERIYKTFNVKYWIDKDTNSKWLKCSECGELVLYSNMRYLSIAAKNGCLCRSCRKGGWIKGKRFGRLIALEITGKTSDNTNIWKCKCDCGNIVNIKLSSLKNGDTKSCGCLQIENRITHGESHTRFYHIWKGMVRRCYSDKDTSFQYYGGRGIRVCDEWRNNYLKFKEDMKESYDIHCLIHGEANTTIDRLNNNGNYYLNNCEWKTYSEQNKNKRNNRQC